ncbi:hypothetical protein MTR67_052444 [Solanum verrucosum]|uniref:SKP1-like protein n=1 Tax=Solanum verrucosum TaxID=315347 RepID=A0AAF1A3I8_SOLVR|nr:hypothetical protein MTR67_052444 [Solanum verrucosum]
MSSSSKFLALQTCDGKEFVLDEVIAVRSQTIKNMVEDDCVSNVIPLPNVDSKTMTKVLEYWKKHSEEGVSKDMLIYFDKAFVNVHHSILYDFILAANFLNDKEILDIICQEVANRIKGKTPEEILIEYGKKHSEEGVSKDMLMDFDKAFVKVHHLILHALILDANFLNDMDILNMMCQDVAYHNPGVSSRRNTTIKRKPPEEIRKEFDIKNDFTPVEEEEIRKENIWAFE